MQAECPQGVPYRRALSPRAFVTCGPFNLDNESRTRSRLELACGARIAYRNARGAAVHVPLIGPAWVVLCPPAHREPRRRRSHAPATVATTPGSANARP